MCGAGAVPFVASAAWLLCHLLIVHASFNAVISIIVEGRTGAVAIVVPRTAISITADNANTAVIVIIVGVSVIIVSVICLLPFAEEFSGHFILILVKETFSGLSVLEMSVFCI